MLQDPASFVKAVLLENVQTINAAADVKSANGGLFDCTPFEYVLYGLLITAETGTVTSVELRATESDANTAAGQSDVSGGSITITPDAGKMALLQVRVRPRKKFMGARVLVTGGTSVGVVVFALGFHTRDTVELSALSTLLTAAAALA